MQNNFDSQFGGIQFNKFNPQPNNQMGQPQPQSTPQPQTFNRQQPQPTAQPQQRNQGFASPIPNQQFSQPQPQRQQPINPQPQVQSRPQQMSQSQPNYNQNSFNAKKIQSNEISTAKSNPNENYSLELASGRVVLSPEICNQFVAGGQKLTQLEFDMFYNLCKVTGANPFLHECHLIKYGSQPAQMVIDYKFLEKSIEKDANYDGMEQGVVVVDSNGNPIEREGALKFPNEQLVAGWCKIYRKDKSHPTKVYAMFDEFYATTKSGSMNSNWEKKPSFMITKVAEAQCIRKAFPNSVSNVYVDEEAAIIENDIINNERSEMNCQAMDNVIDANVNTIPLDDNL